MIDYKGYLLIGAFVASFWSGWKVHEWKHASDELIRIEAQIEAQRRIDNALYEVSLQTQEAIANITIENRTIYNETRREILREPVYTECVLTPEGIRLGNQARGFE